MVMTMDDVPSLSARAPEGAQAVASGGPRAGKKLGVLQLVGVIFMAVAGGPYGFEVRLWRMGRAPRVRDVCSGRVVAHVAWYRPAMTLERVCMFV